MSQRININSEIQALRLRSEGLVRAEGALDVKGALAFFAENAIVQPSGSPQIKGHEEITRMYQQHFEDGQLKEFSAKGLDITISQGGNLAYEYGVNRAVFASPEGDLVDVGKYLVVWEKINGEWMAVVLTFSSDASVPFPIIEE